MQTKEVFLDPSTLPGSLPWQPCHCIQVDGRTKGFEDQWITVPDAIHPKHHKQQISLSFIIEPRICITAANVDVLLRISTFSVGVLQPIMSDTEIGFYPVRIKLWIEPKLDNASDIAIPIYWSRDGKSTRIRKKERRVSAQLGCGPVALKGESSSGVDQTESTETEIVTVGEFGQNKNRAVLEWKLVRWSHNWAEYNEHKPHHGLSPWPTKLKGPFAEGGTSANVEKFPGISWHFHPRMRSKFPLIFKFGIKLTMHILWFAGKDRLFRAAEWETRIFKVPEKEFVVTDGMQSDITDDPPIA